MAPGLAAAGALLLALALPRPAAGAGESSQFLIDLDGTGPPDLRAAVQSSGGALVHELAEIGAASALSDEPGFARRLRRVPGIRGVVRDPRIAWIPELPDLAREGAPFADEVVPSPLRPIFLACQWHMSQIDAPGAWERGHLGSGATVAVLDTGVSGDPAFGGGLPQVDMIGQLVGNVTRVSQDEPDVCVPAGAFDSTSPLDYRFHGTFVAGLVAARGIRVAGVAPEARILGVKVLDCTGQGTFGDVIAGILFAADQPQVDVINMSLSAYFPKSWPGAGALVGALNRAIHHAQAVKGKLVVASAGNNAADLDHDRNRVVMPAQAGAAISAWAGDIDGHLARYSNHGLSGAWVGAPGGDETPDSPSIPLVECGLPRLQQDGIVSVCSPDSIFFPDCSFGRSLLFGATGTSFAAPLVSGVGALVVGARGPMRGGALKTHLANTADDLGREGADPLFSHGRVDAARAVQDLPRAPREAAPAPRRAGFSSRPASPRRPPRGSVPSGSWRGRRPGTAPGRRSPRAPRCGPR